MGAIFKKYNRPGKNKGTPDKKRQMNHFCFWRHNQFMGLINKSINQSKQNKNASTETYIMEFIIHMTLSVLLENSSPYQQLISEQFTRKICYLAKSKAEIIILVTSKQLNMATPIKTSSSYVHLHPQIAKASSTSALLCALLFKTG